MTAAWLMQLRRTTDSGRQAPARGPTAIRLLFARHLERVIYLDTKDIPALSRIERARCLILDVQLPGVLGPTLYAQLREPRPPAIFITSHDNGATRLAVANAGGVHFLVKPFAGTDLLKLIAMLGAQ
jgi:FixJ family two-component response regulator